MKKRSVLCSSFTIRNCFSKMAGKTLLNVASSVLRDRTGSSTRRVMAVQIEKPSIAIDSLPFVPPPRWAVELPKRLQSTFPQLAIHRNILYMKALTHPSFTTESAKGGTMASLAPLGNAALSHCSVAWVATVFPSLSAAEAREILNVILGEEALSAVLRTSWKLDDMILTDAVIRSLKQSNSSKGLIQWVQRQRDAGGQVLPLQYHRMCVEAVVGAVYVDNGLDAVTEFIFSRVLTPALEYLTVE